MEINQILRKARIDQKLSQKKLSELSGIPVRTIQDYEAGKCKPKVDKLDKLVKALNMKIVDIIRLTADENGKMSPENRDYWLCHTAVSSSEFDKEIEKKYALMNIIESIVMEDHVNILAQRESECYHLSKDDFSIDELLEIFNFIKYVIYKRPKK